MKKFLALFLAMIMALSLVACGGKEEAPAEKPAETPSEAPAEEPAGTIKVGVFQPLTGNSAYMGSAGNNAVKLAAKQINEAGGILGMQIEVVSYDDKSSPEEAVKSVNKMLEVDEVDMIVGSLHSGNIQACGDIVEDAQVPLLGTGTSPQWLQKGWTYLFRPTLNTYYSSLAAVQACEALGYKTLVTFYSQDEYGKNGNDNMVAICEEFGIEILASESMKPGDSDMTAQCANLAAAGADAMYMIATADNLPAMVKQARAGGFDKYIIGEQSLGQAEVKNVAGEAANGIVYGACFIMPLNDPSEAQIPEIVKFFEDYMAEYGELCPSEVAVRCYDAMYIYKAAVEKAGSIDGTAVRDAMYTLEYDGLQGHFDYSMGSGEGLSASRLYIIDDMKDVLMDDYLASK